MLNTFSMIETMLVLSPQIGLVWIKQSLKEIFFHPVFNSHVWITQTLFAYTYIIALYIFWPWSRWCALPAGYPFIIIATVFQLITKAKNNLIQYDNNVLLDITIFILTKPNQQNTMFGSSRMGDMIQEFIEVFAIVAGTIVKKAPDVFRNFGASEKQAAA